MKFTDIFKGGNLIALIGAIVVCLALSLIGIPWIFVVVVAFALGCNNKNFAEWIQINVIDKMKR